MNAEASFRKLMSPEERAKCLSEWQDYVCKHNDLFVTNRCGYWAYGAEHIDLGPERGIAWLIYERDGDSGCGGDYPEDDQVERMEEIVRNKGELPKGWYLLDRAKAECAYVFGERAWGERWQDEGDATTEDIVIQLALLGELRYG